MVSVFKKVVNEDGSEHFVGTINLGELRKLGSVEIPVVLVPGELMAKGVMDLFKKGTGSADLLMLGELRTEKVGRVVTKG